MKFYITTAIDYVNSIPHIGTAYEKIGADVLARFKRMDGYDVFFLMGNDEHSINVKKEAISQGMIPQDYCDAMAPKFRETWQKLEISYDKFIRTTDPQHEKGVVELFNRIYRNGDLYKGSYKGLYCDSCEAFLTEKDLVDGLCPNHKRSPRKIEEQNYFFRLSRFGGPLLKIIKDNPSFIMPEIRRNEVVKLIESGLEDISISRSTFDWGIPLPVEPNHVIYVWFDALINYLTGVGFGSDESEYSTWWPADIHVIGKDITRFHCIIWPSMLLSAGLELPRCVFGHGFVYQKGEKMSKSLGNIVKPLDIVDKYGASPLRYYLLREGSFGKDSDFTWEKFISRYNNDLANDLGNLLQRVLNMIVKYQQGEVKPGIPDTAPRLQSMALNLVPRLRELLDHQYQDINFHNALSEIWSFINEVNRYVDKSAPWTLKKQGHDKELATILYNCMESLRFIAIAIKPFLPSTGQAIWNQTGLGTHKNFNNVSFKDNAEWGGFPHGTRVLKDQSLFPKIERNPEITIQKEKKTMNTLTFEEFKKMDLRVALIRKAERVEGTNKLLKLQITLGTEDRQIVAGIADRYPPEQLVGKTIVVIANLEPATIRGVESNGMLLAADSDEHGPVLLTLDKPVKPGTKIL